MARPRKAKQDKRTERLPSLRMTPKELEDVKAAAANVNQPVSQYARGMILNGQIVAGGVEEVDPALVLELKRIGTNLNQAVKKLHQTGVPNPMLEDSAKQLNAFMDQLIEKLL
ncbi:plasmid mobilization protein [Calothrix rhizosoleniae]|uniref:plasmid mobilization protein n=1 Tax=Calothrix rhizosoleniae TaxID=888997 RepID=UPI000B49A4C5|nr:plasmid mobilization relaxosome protein MobC [Calothrix rhizosoleniae]